MAKRIPFIDVAKGICMILVVLQHVHTYYLKVDTGEFYFESFRMPLFFMISGMFFKPYDNFSCFLKRKIDALIIPFLFFYSLFSVLIPNFLFLIGYDGLREVSKLGWMSVFNFVLEKNYSNSPVWFLLALFWLNLLFYGIRRLAICSNEKNSIKLLVLFSSMCGLLGFALGANHVFLWANLDNALTATPYYCIGYLLFSKIGIAYRTINRYFLLAVTVIGVIVIFYMSPGIGYLQNRFPPDTFLPLYISGVVGAFTVLSFSKTVENVKVLSFYGENTLVMLCLQMPLIQICRLFVRHFYAEGGVLEIILILIVTLIAFIPVIMVMKRYLPWACGKARFFCVQV